MKGFHYVDNFLADPDAERKKALSAEYEEIAHRDIKYRGISFHSDDLVASRIKEILGCPDFDYKCFYRRYLEKEQSETHIHNDHVIGTFTAILFLNPPEQCYGGTAFWRHKLTGWAHHPTQEMLDAAKVKDEPETWQAIISDGFAEKKWDMIDYCPMEYNRLLLFWSARFHSRWPQAAFGHDLESARLIKTFFFKPKE